LTDQSPTTGSQSRSYGDLAFARGGAGEQEICNIGAGDQKNEADSSKQDEYRRADAAYDLLMKRNQIRAISFLAGELFGDASGDCA
jgi:hypothetical protein